MIRLEDIKNGASIAGVVPNQIVEAVSVEWIGDQAINLVYRVPGGSVSETTLCCDPRTDHVRCIEVMGRVDGADTVMITGQEVITSLHEPEKFILTAVRVEDGFARAPRYVRGALNTRELPFGHNAIQVSIKSLVEGAEVPK